jgi:hypothetical protein
MPLHIEIKVNEKDIETIHIGRMDRLDDPDSVYEYMVTTEEYPQTMYEGKKRVYSPNFNVGTKFTHRYSDGVRICIMKALEALGPETK